ncbi:ATP-binding protein [Candidatus Dependentiae bacterium]|nr:ATP-binding protein [Candidatus Dependentiae bacterium]
MIISRDLQPHLLKAATHFPVVAILGPRQSGKTTLAKLTFAEYTYLSLEDFDTRERIARDPRAFLADCNSAKGVILDEFQHVPQILSYIQTYVDEKEQNGFFVLTGSQNFLVNESITQSLAGRIAIMTLLPLSAHEIQQAGLLPMRYEPVVTTGFAPVLWGKQVPPVDWYRGFLTTYIERDIRQIKNIKDLSLFKTFMALCAGRIGQQLNVTTIANDCGITVQTARNWLSLLDATYITFPLMPFYKNFNKRITKTPKLYFYDTGLAAYLLSLTPELVERGSMRGPLFEAFVIAELMKGFHNRNLEPRLFYWQDQTGNEVDCLIGTPLQQHAIEIKAGMTVSQDYFKGLSIYKNLAGDELQSRHVVYAGDQAYDSCGTNITPWDQVDAIVQKIIAR